MAYANYKRKAPPELADKLLQSAGYQRQLAERRKLMEAKKADEIAPDGSVNEQSLALSWNVPRSAMSAIRKGHLREHWHWRIGPSGNQGDIRITREGIEELKKWVVPPEKVVPPPAPEAVRENLAPAEIPPEDPDIVIVHRVPPNPRMLICRDAQGELVSLRVRSNSMFRAGMKVSLKAQCEFESSPGLDKRSFLFKGKYPKAYGRW